MAYNSPPLPLIFLIQNPLSEFTDSHDGLRIFDTVDIGNAIEVIDLVLKDARPETGCFFRNLFPCFHSNTQE